MAVTMGIWRMKFMLDLVMWTRDGAVTLPAVLTRLTLITNNKRGNILS